MSSGSIASNLSLSKGLMGLAFILSSIFVSSYKASNVSTITNFPVVPLTFNPLIFLLIISSASAFASSDHIPLTDTVSPSSWSKIFLNKFMYILLHICNIKNT